MQDTCPNCGRHWHNAVLLSGDGGLFGDGMNVRCRDCGTEYERQLTQ